MELADHFKTFLQEQNLCSKKILICVSGGVDSMSLLEVASQVCAKKNIGVFHLDHNTRFDSQSDKYFVQLICSSKRIKFFSEKLDKKFDQNKEKNWRDSRQKAAENAAESFGADRILTAHHATDLVETMIFRLTKGAGPGGLAPFDVSTKPFWRVAKSEILAFARAEKVAFRTDPSNESLEFDRNLIRKKVLPALRKITPNLEKVFEKQSEIFAETAEFLSNSVPKTEKNSVEISLFLRWPKILQREFLRQKCDCVPSFAQMQDFFRWLENAPKGGSEKTLGQTRFRISKKLVIW